MNIKKLKKLRKNNDLTQKDVAELIGISRPMYNMIENGIRNPSLEVMQKIVDLFGEEAKDIFFNNGVA
ncbi:helix-turn-helix transcriptional regulator [Halanaerobium salsuginis]|uniref:Putative transcriptional regulator n=1 Tax=Halanaerobium salsuginis TaxID=29563 RepID=A0A1I4EW26_9FIRM|nr:helix-turn-helix transcriptional regulator [Halanaerobium salsuginis]SFL09509.1 putative transcriptional regulator [Halanaerobium salsuginis]